MNRALIRNYYVNILESEQEQQTVRVRSHQRLFSIFYYFLYEYDVFYWTINIGNFYNFQFILCWGVSVLGSNIHIGICANVFSLSLSLEEVQLGQSCRWALGHIPATAQDTNNGVVNRK